MGEDVRLRKRYFTEGREGLLESLPTFSIVMTNPEYPPDFVDKDVYEEREACRREISRLELKCGNLRNELYLNEKALDHWKVRLERTYLKNDS